MTWPAIAAIALLRQLGSSNDDALGARCPFFAFNGHDGLMKILA